MGVNLDHQSRPDNPTHSLPPAVMRMHQTQTSSLFPFEVLHCSAQKIGKHCENYTRMACWPFCDRTQFFYTAREAHWISKLSQMVVHSWTFGALLWKNRNAYGKQAGLDVRNDQWSNGSDVIKWGGATGPSHDRWLDKHPPERWGSAYADTHTRTCLCLPLW